MTHRLRHLPLEAALAIGALVPFAALRLHQAQPGLLYPDGYQYLLMAKGLAAHGRPFLTLGPGGDTLLPSVDAAAKPLYPALVALLHLLGIGWIAAARLVNAVAAALTVVLAALLARRLTGSWLGAAAAAAGCLVSRELAFWSGFAGPDSLAQALALATALALLSRRPYRGGILAALAVLARPELVLLALSAALVGVALPQLRQSALRSSLAFAIALAALLAVLRPPLAMPAPGILATGIAASALTAACFLILRRGGGRATALAAGVIAAVALTTALTGRSAGIELWARHDWPLLVAGAVGFLVAARTAHRRPAAIGLLLAGTMLALVYWEKNPGSERYPALLTPLLAVLVGFAVVAPPATRRLMAPATAGLLALGLALGAPAPSGPDAFPTVARELHTLPLRRLPVVTAAPDAYGVLLSRQPVRVARPGARGLIVMDGAQREYSPRLHVAGRVVARLDPGPGFLRPDGTVDRRAVTVVLGTVVASS